MGLKKHNFEDYLANMEQQKLITEIRLWELGVIIPALEAAANEAEEDPVVKKQREEYAKQIEEYKNSRKSEACN